MTTANEFVKDRDARKHALGEALELLAGVNLYDTGGVNSTAEGLLAIALALLELADAIRDAA